MVGVLPCLGVGERRWLGPVGSPRLEKPGVPGPPSTAPAWVPVTTAVSCGCQDLWESYPSKNPQEGCSLGAGEKKKSAPDKHPPCLVWCPGHWRLGWALRTLSFGSSQWRGLSNSYRYKEPLTTRSLLHISLELLELVSFSVLNKHFSWELHQLTLGWKHLLLKILFSKATCSKQHLTLGCTYLRCGKPFPCP